MIAKKEEMNKSFDELLEYRHLRYMINELKNELARAEYSIVDCETKKSILESASGPFKSAVSGNNSGRIHIDRKATESYDETTVVYDKWLGIEHNYNGLFQAISATEFDLDTVSPAPSNEGNKIAVVCEVSDQTQRDKISSIVEEFPYYFDLLVYGNDKNIIGNLTDLNADNLCKLLIRTYKEDKNKHDEFEVFSDQMSDYDEVVILELDKEFEISNLGIRRIAALFHNVLDLACFESDIVWLHLGRLIEKNCSLKDILTGDRKGTILSGGLAIAGVEGDKRVKISRNSSGDGCEDKNMSKNNYEIPEDTEAMKQELLRCLERISELEEEQNDLKESVQKKKDETEARSRSIIDKMENQMSLLKMENTGLKVANAEIKNSMSWRVTKPLRDFGALFIK